MERQGTFLDWMAKAAVLLAMALAPPAHAQSTGSINDFQLPPGDAPQPPPVTGPVDAELPANGTSSAPAPPPAPQPAPARPPVAAETAPPPIVIPIRPGEPADVTARPRTAVRAPAPAVETAPEAVPAPVSSGQTSAIVAPELPPAPAQTTIPTVVPAPARPAPWIWWLAGAALLGLLLAGFGFILRRRLRSAAIEEDGWADVGAAETGDVPPLPEKSPAPISQAASARPIDVSAQVELAFEPRHLTMALINARLAYRLSLTNRADAAIGSVSIACDIISAHASLSHDAQLSFESGMAEPQHKLGSLGPGETVALTGELQIPIAAILPIHSGDASLFVPLARFHITMLGVDRPPLTSTRIFVIGERPEQPWERLRPLRLDRGQRTFSSIGQREIVASA